MHKYINFMIQLSECSPKKRGKPISDTSGAGQESGVTCSQKRASDGQTIYYLTEKGKQQKKGYAKFIQRKKDRDKKNSVSKKEPPKKEPPKKEPPKKEPPKKEPPKGNALLGSINNEEVKKAFKLEGIENITIDRSKDEVTIKGKGKIGEFEREFRTEKGKLIVEHSYFDLAPDIQGKGISKKLLSNSLDLYEKLGVKEIVLTANLGVGGYAWASAGFKGTKEEIQKETSGLAQILGSPKIANIKSMQKLSEVEISSGEFSTFLKGLKLPDKPTRDPRNYKEEQQQAKIYSLRKKIIALQAPNAIQDLRLASPNGKIKIGKWWLMGAKWEGKMKLTGRDYEKFKKYLGKK